MECNHKWKIIKDRIIKTKLFFQIEYGNRLILQCEKCGDLKKVGQPLGIEFKEKEVDG